MTDVAMPKFNFRSSFSEEEVRKTEDSRAGGEYLGPGQHDVKIKAAEFKKMMVGDPTWASYMITLEDASGKPLKHFVSVPTKDITYNKPGIEPRAKMMFFHKLRDFFRAIGVDPDIDNVGQNITQLFGVPERLVGAELTVTVGYRGAHLQYSSDGISIVSKNGTKITDELFKDKDSATAAAAEQGLVIERFAEVTRLHPKVVEEVSF